MGKRVDLIVPEEYRAIHRAGFARRSARRGSPGWDPVEGLHKNGERVALEVFLTPIQDANEHGLRRAWIVRVPGRN